MPLGLTSVADKDTATLNIRSNHSINTRKQAPPHPLAKYTKEPWLYPPPPHTKERLSVGRAKAPHRLASRWCPFRSPLQTHSGRQSKDFRVYNDKQTVENKQAKNKTFQTSQDPSCTTLYKNTTQINANYPFTSHPSPTHSPPSTGICPKP